VLSHSSKNTNFCFSNSKLEQAITYDQLTFSSQTQQLKYIIFSKMSKVFLFGLVIVAILLPGIAASMVEVLSGVCRMIKIDKALIYISKLPRMAIQHL
jgi:hypothetical protein